MADLDLAELRRSVDDALQRPGGGIVAVLPEALLALLDRLEAAEARTVELVNELDDERVAYAELLAERDPRAELVQVGWGGCVGHSTCEVDEGHEWYLRHLDDKHELDRTHPIWPVYALRAVPGAVAGEPGGERCDAPWRTSAGLIHQCNRWVLHDGGTCSCRCGFTWPTPIRQPDPLTAPVVAGEPESTPAAEPPDIAEVVEASGEAIRRQVLADVRHHLGGLDSDASETAHYIAEQIGAGLAETIDALRELHERDEVEWLIINDENGWPWVHTFRRHPRAADTQEAHDA